MSEVIEEMADGLALVELGAGGAIERGEGAGFAVLEDGADAGHPVGALAVDEVGDDVEDGPGGVALVAVGPYFGEAAQEGVEGGGGAGEEGGGLVEVLLHGWSLLGE